MCAHTCAVLCSVHTHVQLFVFTSFWLTILHQFVFSTSNLLPDFKHQLSGVPTLRSLPQLVIHHKKRSANCPFFCYIFQLLLRQKGWEGALPPHSWVFLPKRCLAYVDKSYSIRAANETVAHVLPFQTKTSLCSGSPLGRTPPPFCQ